MCDCFNDKSTVITSKIEQLGLFSNGASDCPGVKCQKILLFFSLKLTLIYVGKGFMLMFACLIT